MRQKIPISLASLTLLNHADVDFFWMRIALILSDRRCTELRRD